MIIGNKKKSRPGVINNVIVCLYDPKKAIPPSSEYDVSFSEDVCIIDEKGLHGLAYFCYRSDRWRFHTNTEEDYNDLKLNIRWRWYHPPVKVSDINW